MTAAACVERTERVQSGLPQVFVCALACISMQTPGGRCSFLRAGTMFKRINVGVQGRGRKLVTIQTGARACQQRSLAAAPSAQPPKSECELAAQRLDVKIRSLPKFHTIELASLSTMTAAACVDRTERVQSGLPRVFVCTLACISMQTPGGRCSFLRAAREYCNGRQHHRLQSAASCAHYLPSPYTCRRLTSDTRDRAA